MAEERIQAAGGERRAAHLLFPGLVSCLGQGLVEDEGAAHFPSPAHLDADGALEFHIFGFRMFSLAMSDQKQRRNSLNFQGSGRSRGKNGFLLVFPHVRLV